MCELICRGYTYRLASNYMISKNARLLLTVYTILLVLGTCELAMLYLIYKGLL